MRCKVYRVTTYVPPDRVDALLDGIVREVRRDYGRYDRAAWWSAVGVRSCTGEPRRAMKSTS